MSDEFLGGIWWRPDGGPLGGLRSATPGECVQEIQRLRVILAAIIDADERGQGVGYAEAMDAAVKAIRT